jgi:hypothetical protein
MTSVQELRNVIIGPPSTAAEEQMPLAASLP